MTILSSSTIKTTTPATERESGTLTVAKRADALTVKTPDAALRARLAAYKDANDVSDAVLARLVGSNSTQVNRYLNGRFVGSLETFEAKVVDFFKSDEVRRVDTSELFPTAFTDRVAAFLDTVRRTQDVGLGYSRAGKGKTCGIALFAAANPNAISISLTKATGGVNGVAGRVFEGMESRAWSRHMSRTDFIFSKLRGSRRLLIIDNAHRLTEGGRQWVFDFHDETGCPVALVGNPEVLDAIRRNDQQFSRIGLKREFKSGGSQAEMAAALEHDCRLMVRLHWPEADGLLGDLPQQVARQHGYMRALKKQLLLSREIASGFETPEAAFRAAHTQLVRDYQLK